MTKTPSIKTEWKAAWSAIRKAQRRQTYEHEYRRADGRPAWVSYDEDTASCRPSVLRAATRAWMERAGFPNREERPKIATDDVLEAIHQIPDITFTTWDLAFALGTKEYAVRGAVAWLIERKVIHPSGVRRCYTKKTHHPYYAKTYAVVDRGCPPDIAALYRAFCS